MLKESLRSNELNISNTYTVQTYKSFTFQQKNLEFTASGKPKTRIKQNQGDRFIPSKISSNAYNLMTREKIQTLQSQPHDKRIHQTQTYESLLSSHILGESIKTKSKKNKIMHFNQQNTNQKENIFIKQCSIQKQKKVRKIQKHAFKILEAPSLQDDFYLNLLDWSPHNNIAVGLQSSVYLWSGCSSKVIQLYETEDISDYICSVAFSPNNPHIISFGNTLGQIKLFDINKRRQIQTLCGHTGRVGSLNWNGNGGILASGARDGSVVIWDSRKSELVQRYKAHGQEICGLKWSNQGAYIASGGNDNKLVVYSTKASKQLIKFHEHKAAVKAIGWCPQNTGLLASGGGTADRHIRFFSTQTLNQTHALDTVFSKISNQMVSTHGYSLNQINVWSTKSNWEQNVVEKMATLTGHTYRVLYLAGSPDGSSVLTGAGDQTLRFWNVFDRGELVKHQALNFTMDLR